MDETHARKPLESAEIPQRPPEGLRTYFDDAEKGWREYIVERYGQHMTAEQVAEVRHVPVAVESDHEFAESLRGVTGAAPEPGVTGYYTDAGGAHVRRETNSDVVETIGHEILHSAASLEAEAALPREALEGFVERRAQQAMGRESLVDQGETVAYAQGQVSVEAVDAACGPQTMDKAYFEGDMDGLRRCLDHAVKRPLGENPEDCN